MLDKLIKGLSGLGGAAALTTGGVFLKNHVERKMFISRANANIKKLWENNSGYEGLYPDGDSVDDAWKISWILSVIGYTGDNVSIKNNFTKAFLKQREEAFWKAIMKTWDAYIKIDMDEKRKIDGKYEKHWEKYKEGCLVWGSFRRPEDASQTDAECMLPEKWETYKERIMYKKYLETKENRENLDLMDFYWTIWRRFKKEKDSELSDKFETNSSHYNAFSTAFENWKTGKEDLFSEIDK